MIRFQVAAALLFCSILPVGSAFAAQTIDVGPASHQTLVFAPVSNIGKIDINMQRMTLASGKQPVGKTASVQAATAPAEENSSSVWLIGAGFGTIFLVAARRRRPDIQGV